MQIWREKVVVNKDLKSLVLSIQKMFVAKIPTGWGIHIYAGVCTVLLSLPGDSTCAVVRLTDKCPSLACAELLNSLSCVEWLPFSLPSYLKLLQLLEQAWASLTLAGLHCKTRVCMYVCLLTVWPYIPKFFTEQTETNLRYMYISILYILLKLLKIHGASWHDGPLIIWLHTDRSTECDRGLLTI